MVNYRRARVPGAACFFTVTLRDRRKSTLIDRADLLRSVVRSVWHDRRFGIEAAVVLPDHLHAICTLPPGDADYSGRWRAIQARFSRALAGRGVPIVRNRRGEYDLWQRRFWEHLIRDVSSWGFSVSPCVGGLLDGVVAWQDLELAVVSCGEAAAVLTTHDDI